jgi:hypothetical protein
MVNDLLAGVDIPKNQATPEEIARGEKLVAEKRRLAAAAKPMYDAMLTQVALEVGGHPMTTDLKSPGSVARKLRDDYGWDAGQITDILCGTIIVSDVQEAQAAARRIVSQFPQMKRVAVPADEACQEQVYEPDRCRVFGHYDGDPNAERRAGGDSDHHPGNAGGQGGDRASPLRGDAPRLAFADRNREGQLPVEDGLCLGGELPEF